MSDATLSGWVHGAERLSRTSSDASVQSGFEFNLFSGSRGLRIDDVPLAWKFLAGNVLRMAWQGGLPNIIAGGTAGVIRIDRRVCMHWDRS